MNNHLPKPIYTHEICSRCNFLGHIATEKETYDAYICERSPGHDNPIIRWTILLRFGNEGSQYMSGLVFAKRKDHGRLLTVAIRESRLAYRRAADLAIEFGYLPADWDK